MLAKAESQMDLLVSQGMSETLLDDLGKGYEEKSRSGRRDHVGARADLDTVTGEIMEQMRLLDGLVRHRLGRDSELMAAWESARNVPGPFRTKVSPAPPGSGVVPHNSGGVALDA
jgi:hypothetical protein